jgi:antitoxin component of MazEF toxin-antitoxin module
MTANSDTEKGDEVSKVLANQYSPSSVNSSLLARAQAPTLENLVGKITPDNCHSELDFGIAAGVELM